VLKAYPCTELDLRPHERSRSAGELAWTFTVVEAAIDGVVKGEMGFRKIFRRQQHYRRRGAWGDEATPSAGMSWC
jgi:hypothetical protein